MREFWVGFFFFFPHHHLLSLIGACEVLHFCSLSLLPWVKHEQGSNALCLWYTIIISTFSERERSERRPGQTLLPQEQDFPSLLLPREQEKMLAILLPLPAIHSYLLLLFFSSSPSSFYPPMASSSSSSNTESEKKRLSLAAKRLFPKWILQINKIHRAASFLLCMSCSVSCLERNDWGRQQRTASPWHHDHHLSSPCNSSLFFP